MKSPLFVVIALMMTHLAIAQDRKITGRVVDEETGKPIINVAIIIPGTTKGTFSNTLGFFELNVSSSDKTLIASHVTFVTSRINVPKEDRFKFTLKKQHTRLTTLFVEDFPVDSTKEPILLCRKPRPRTDGLTIIESPACPPLGIRRFYARIGNSVSDAAKRSVAPVLGVSFTVDETGHVTNVQVSDSLSLLAAPVKAALTQMSPWTPAYQNGQAVPQNYTFLITHKGGTNDEAVTNFQKILGEKLKYPYEADRDGKEGLVNIEFTVDREWKATDVIALSDIGGGLSEIKRRLRDVPVEDMKSLVKNTNTNRFLLPVIFTNDLPYKKNTRTTASTAYRLPEIFVTRYRSYAQPTKPSSDFLEQGVQILKIDVADAVKQAKRTKTLSLREQAIKSFPAEIFQLDDLRLLEMDKNELIELPSQIGLLSNLRALFLTQNRIKSLPKTFDDLRRLETLDLNSNELQEFHEEILHLEELEALDLSNNDITAIPEGISSLTKLRFLIAANNKISSVPKVLGALSSLEELELMGNKIKSFPGTLDGFQKLRKLDLAINELQAFPEGILRMKNLEALYLNYNSIPAIPHDIDMLTDLRVLDLSNNKITSIPENVGDLRNLLVLVIKGNPISPQEVEKFKSQWKNIKIVF